MKEYEVTFVETVKRTILVKAASKQVAMDMAIDKEFESEEIQEEEFQGNVVITNVYKVDV